jgi:glycosyltransferase involved in cell wall biosynthesis
MPKISVIVPIYNTENYLRKCLYSVINQSFIDIEILCINDCSNDNSSLIVKELARQDKRVKLIEHSENLGLGGARNTGIKSARATHIASVDSDDYMHPDMLSKMWQASENQTIDVVVCGMTVVDAKGSTIEIALPDDDIIHNNNHSINIFTATNPSFVNKLWCKSLFIDNNIWFPNYIYYQDLATTPRILAMVKVIKFINIPLYYYCVRNGSATRSFSNKHILDFLTLFEVLYEFLIEHDLYERYQVDFWTRIQRALTYHTSQIVSLDVKEENKLRHLKLLFFLRTSLIRLFHKRNSSPDSVRNGLYMLRKAIANTDGREITGMDLDALVQCLSTNFRAG